LYNQGEIAQFVLQFLSVILRVWIGICHMQSFLFLGGLIALVSQQFSTPFL